MGYQAGRRLSIAGGRHDGRTGAERQMDRLALLPYLMEGQPGDCHARYSELVASAEQVDDPLQLRFGEVAFRRGWDQGVTALLREAGGAPAAQPDGRLATLLREQQVDVVTAAMLPYGEAMFAHGWHAGRESYAQGMARHLAEYNARQAG